MPPSLLVELSEFNRNNNGLVEAYIYKSLQNKLNIVSYVETYIENSTADTFQLLDLLHFFEVNPGLKRSVDKMFEIIVYALFSSIVTALKAEVSIEITNKDEMVIRDFEKFIKMVLGLDANIQKASRPASLFRIGVTNAADSGLDMLSNFGPVIQVKHLTLTPELAEDITTGITSDSIIVVCLDTEEAAIRTLLLQLGLDSRIQGIIVLKDLENWYKLSLSDRHRNHLGSTLLNDLKREFEAEFPSSREVQPFLEERKYNIIDLPDDWNIKVI